jgi:alpha-ketoglutarate-dependent taurine dioxygenase
MMSASAAVAQLVPQLADRPATASGVFVEQPFHRHVATREAALRRAEWLPQPELVQRFALAADDLERSMDPVVEAVRDAGIAKLELDRILTNDELVAFGRHFGDVMVHNTSPDLQRQIEGKHVFNLRQEHAATTRDYALSLISQNYLTMHSEVCVRSAPDQPRYIALLCLEPSPPDTGGQTVFTAMADVHARLTAVQAEILGEAHFTEFPVSPPILSWREGRPVFSFRDFGTDLMWWRYVGDRALAEGEFNAAIKDLLAAIYDPALWFGISWRAAEVVIFDNWRFFHGRTLIQSVTDERRHFKNIKIN